MVIYYINTNIYTRTHTRIYRIHTQQSDDVRVRVVRGNGIGGGRRGNGVWILLYIYIVIREFACWSSKFYVYRRRNRRRFVGNSGEKKPGKQLVNLTV